MRPFSLTYREQQQLFLYTKNYIGSLLARVGGLSMLVSRFIVQFFVTPWLASAITIALSLLMAWLLWLGLRRRGDSGSHDGKQKCDWQIIPLCLVPPVYMIASLADNEMSYDAFVALIFSAAALALFNKSRKLFSGILCTIILYIIAGPVAVVFAVTALIICIFNDKPQKAALSLVYPLTAVACAWISYLCGLTGSFTMGLSPEFFYNHGEEMPAGHWIAWAAVPVTAVLVNVSYSLKKKIYSFLIAAVLCCIAVFHSVHLESGLSDKGNEIYCKCEYYSEKGEWDKVIESTQGYLEHPFFGNYLNMALAYKGVLADDVLKYYQSGPYSIFTNKEDNSAHPRLARVEYAMGNMPGAQVIAFNCLHSNNGYSPSMLKMIARIELMRGSWDVAEKYLNILGQSWHYRKWAEHYRTFLNDDEAVAEDPDLGPGRAAFPHEEGFVVFASPVDELFRILDTDPSNSRAMQYCLSYLLLARDINSTYRFVKKYYGTPGLKTLPVPAQEAIAFFSYYYSRMNRDDAIAHGVAGEDFDEYQTVDTAWCREHGVTEETFDRLGTFMREGQGGRTSSGRTFWSYLLNRK